MLEPCGLPESRALGKCHGTQCPQRGTEGTTHHVSHCSNLSVGTVFWALQERDAALGNGGLGRYASQRPMGAKLIC